MKTDCRRLMHQQSTILLNEFHIAPSTEEQLFITLRTWQIDKEASLAALHQTITELLTTQLSAAQHHHLLHLQHYLNDLIEMRCGPY